MVNSFENVEKCYINKVKCFLFLDCGGTLTNRFGSLSTPDGYYPENIECLWLIKPYPKPTERTLNLKVDHFDVGCKDSLEINDGGTPTSRKMMLFPPGRLFISHLSAFRLVFKSNGSCGSNRTKRFNATYWTSGIN